VGAKGAAYVFIKAGSNWSNTSTPTATLINSIAVKGDDLGNSVAINSATGIIVAGAPGVSST